MNISKTASLFPAALFLIVAVNACSAPADESETPSSDGQAAEQTPDQQGDQTDAQSGGGATNSEPEAPVEITAMTKTAWRAQGEDGAVYTTFFDDDGNYRDFKNGEPMQSGTWEERNDGKLCFTPAKEGRIGECWTLGPMQDDDMMRPESDDGKTVELRKVTYLAPEEEN